MSEQKNILLVDDSVENLKYLHMLLKSAGFRVMPAPNGKMALQALETNTPDLILMDINMPEISGLEVCKKIRAQAHLMELPIIFISGSAKEDELDAVLNSGGNDLLHKPFSMQELLNIIRQYLP